MTSVITKQSILALSVAAALGMSVAAGPAHAHASAYANLNINGIKVFDDTTNTQITTANAGSYLANLAAVNTASNTATRSLPLPVTTDVQSAGPAPSPIDAPQACVGTCVGQNIFTQTAGFPSANTFERADSQLTGQILDPAGATARTVAESQIPGVGAGLSNSTVGTSTGFTFTAAAGVPVRFEFNADGTLATTLLPASGLASSASASMAYSINLTDRTANQVVLNFSDGALNTNRSVTNPPGTGTSNYVLPSTLFSATSLALVTGHDYQLTISQTVSQSETDTDRVPEPTTLVLLGSGLLGFGAVRRFRKA